MKRVISALLIVVIAFCPSALFVYAENSRFTATDSSFSGYTEYATREQAIACFIKAVGIERFKTDDAILNKFSDNRKVSFAYREAMSAAVYSGLVCGYEDRTLRPQEPIVKIEALVVLARALSRNELADWYTAEFSDTPDWAKAQIDRLASAGIVKGYGDGTLGARDFLTIEQVNTLCDRITRLTGPAGSFYDYVNSAWLDSVQVDKDTPVRSASDDISQNVSRDIGDIIFSLYRRHYNDGENFVEDSAEKKIINVYSAAADMGYRDKLGLKPLEDILEKINGIRSIDDFVRVSAELDKMGFPSLISVRADVNVYDTSKYIPSVSMGYIGVEPSASSAQINEYEKYAKRLLALAGEERAEELASAAVEVNKKLASAAENSNKIAQDVKIKSIKDIKKTIKNIDIKKYMSYVGFVSAKEVMLYSESFLNAADGLLTKDNLEYLKAYLKVAVLDMSALYLTTDMFDACREYECSIYGGEANQIPSDYATEIVESLLGWELASMYIDMYFPDNARQNVEEIAQKIVGEYEKLINSSLSMPPALREFAVKKLKNLKINIGYPDDIEGYFSKNVNFRSVNEGGNLIEHKIQYNLAYAEHSALLIQKGKREGDLPWSIYPYTVNAMYAPVSNSITVPAGMLKAPYYESGASFEENLGGIGSVIAHEISHAFDRTGLQFDEKGNLSDKADVWGTGTFEAICRQVTEEFDGIKVDGGTVDGALTMNENMADLFGMAAILSLAKTENLDLDKIFVSYAKSWRTKTTKEYSEDMLRTDVHSPARVRVNRVLSNFDEFADFYGIMDGDGMYIPKERRIRIWN